MKPEHYPNHPEHLWQHFYRMTQIPRPSKQEAAVRQYVIDLAEEAGHPWKTDAEGNLVVYVPGKHGLENAEPVIIQNHLDMVTVKTNDKEHDFSADPLQLEVSDGWLSADRTTLGADNGLGCAAAMAVMTDTSVKHPPLELLFTVDEETGLGGALNLDASLLSGRVMLNLDTEDWNELYVGCAGGGGWEFRRQLDTEALAPNMQGWQLDLRGLAGGHSGIQIHQQLGNAIKLLGQLLAEGQALGLRLAGFRSGVAHNVIPREGTLELAFPAGEEVRLRELIDTLRQRWLGWLPGVDAGLTLELQETDVEQVLTPMAQTRLQQLLATFPHGAQSYNLEQPADLVDLSINLAVIELRNGALFLESSFRFFNDQESLPLQQQVLALADLFELDVSPNSGYPGWQPDFDSPLLALGRQTHQELFGSDPAVKAIHAGLECGILKSKKPDVDILSFGPTIRGAHSPSERLKIDTVEPFWQLLVALLGRVSSLT